MICKTATPLFFKQFYNMFTMCLLCFTIFLLHFSYVYYMFTICLLYFYYILLYVYYMFTIFLLYIRAKSGERTGGKSIWSDRESPMVRPRDGSDRESPMAALWDHHRCLLEARLYYYNFIIFFFQEQN